MLRTLYMAARNPAALLVTNSGGKRRCRKMQFKDAHAALDWCLAKQATFLLTPPGAPDPAAN